MDNKLKIDKKNLFLIGRVLLIFLFAIFMLGVGTYAFWTWTNNAEKNVVFTTASLKDQIVYDEGDSKFVGNFTTSDKYCDGANTTISFNKKASANNVDIYANIKMDIKNIGTNISRSSSVYWAITSGNNSISCNTGVSSLASDTNVINYGTFSGKNVDDVITLSSNIPVTTSSQQYTVWIWIDSGGTNLDSLTGETVQVNVWTLFDMVETGP